jgi:hypothetical protein
MKTEIDGYTLSSGVISKIENVVSRLHSFSTCFYVDRLLS